MSPDRPERDPYEADESELADDAAGAADDVPALLARAKAFRSAREMGKCLEAYRAAAALGSAEAEYAVALFYMNGGTVVPQDLKEGTTALRSAAEKGSVPAKVYLGNLYELGIHYKADAEKADVWYRNAARGAKVEAEPGTDEWNRALADLGCARQVLALSKDPSVDEGEKARLLARAKAHGYGLRVRDEAAEGDRATFVNALANAEHAPAPATATPPPVAVDFVRSPKDTSPETGTAKRRAVEAQALDATAQAAAEKAERIAKKQAEDRSAARSVALAAFGYALLFALAGAGAGYAAWLGAKELVAHGHVLPLVGTQVKLVFPIVLGVVGVLPAWLVYRLGTVLKALVFAAVGGGVGWVAWGTGQGAFHGDRPLQALAFAMASFLAGLLVLGLLGGAKQPRPAPRKR